MKSGCSYNSIDAGYPYRLRGTNQQTDNNLLWRPPSYKSWGQNVAPATMRFPGMALGKYALHNRSGGAIVTGIGVRIPNDLWKFGQWVDATTTFTDDTTDAQDTGTDDVALETTTNSDGHVILCRYPFNAISYNVSTASADATNPARGVFYSSAGAWSSSALSNLFVHDGSAAELVTGEQIIVFAPPVNWSLTTGAEGTNIPAGYYGIAVKSTTAPDATAAKATAIEIFRLYELQENVTDNTTVMDDFFGGDLVMAQDDRVGGAFELYGDALVALFSGTANDQSRVTALVRMA